MGDESHSSTTAITEQAAEMSILSVHIDGVSASPSSTTTTTTSPTQTAASAAFSSIRHNGLHPLHPSSSSAALSLSASSLHADTAEVYKVGQLLDVYDPTSEDWYEGRVTRLSTQGIHIHYTGWPDSHDTIIPPSVSYQKKHLHPHRSHTEPWTDESNSACSACGFGGDLLCCDREGCVKVWHLECVHLKVVPKAKWNCPDCRARKKRGGHWHWEETKAVDGEVTVKPESLGKTARKTSARATARLSGHDQHATVTTNGGRAVHRKRWEDTLEDEVDANGWEVQEIEQKENSGQAKQERRKRQGVKWSLRPLRQTKVEEKEDQIAVKFEDEDDEQVRQEEMKYRSDDENDEDYEQEDTEAGEELDERATEEEETTEKEEEEEQWLSHEDDDYDEQEPLIYRRYRRPAHSPKAGDDGKKKIGFGKQSRGETAKAENRKRKRDAPERAAKRKRARLEEERRNPPELPLDNEEAKEEFHAWMSTSRKRAVRSRPDGDDWRYQQDDERLQEEGETAEERAEREHDIAVKNEQRTLQRRLKDERRRRERMWDSSAIYAVLQQLDTLKLLQLVATTIEQMGGDTRIQALVTAAPSLQMLLSTVTAASIAEAYSAGPQTSPPSFPPPPPTFSAFLASLHALVVASVTQRSAELHTYRFFILRSLDLQWRQYIRQHTEKINALWAEIEARTRPDYQIESEMKAEERACDEWRKQFSRHWDAAQRVHDHLEAEERELREWNEWCETRQKEAEEGENGGIVDDQEKNIDSSEAEVASRLEAQREKGGRLILALCMCLLMKWRSMGPVKVIRKAFDAIVGSTQAIKPSSPHPPDQQVTPSSSAPVIADQHSSLPSPPYALREHLDVDGEDDGPVNLDHTIAVSDDTSPPHTTELVEVDEAEVELLDGPNYDYDEFATSDEGISYRGTRSPQHREQAHGSENRGEMDADQSLPNERTTPVVADSEAEVVSEAAPAHNVRSPSRSPQQPSTMRAPRIAVASEDASFASCATSPELMTDAHTEKPFFLPFLSLPVLTADGFESHTLTDFPDGDGHAPLLPIVQGWNDGSAAPEADTENINVQQAAAVVTEETGLGIQTAAMEEVVEVDDAPATSTLAVIATDNELQPCHHTCGCAEPPDTLFADHRSHERDRGSHPLCGEREMECNALFKFSPEERAQAAASSKKRSKSGDSHSSLCQAQVSTQVWLLTVEAQAMGHGWTVGARERRVATHPLQIVGTGVRDAV